MKLMASNKKKSIKTPLIFALSSLVKCNTEPHIEKNHPNLILFFQQKMASCWWTLPQQADSLTFLDLSSFLSFTAPRRHDANPFVWHTPNFWK